MSASKRGVECLNLIVSLTASHKVRKWYEGIHSIFKLIQEKNNWNKQEAWDKLKIELINEVGHENFIPDDLEWIKGLLLDEIFPSTEECLRVAKRYSHKTPLLDALNKLV